MPTEIRHHSLIWDDDSLLVIDQRQLPHSVQQLRITTVDELIDAIRSLAIRGVPALGIAGDFGVALSTHAPMPLLRRLVAA
jgi:methylthioribose-1-phosphate isomerase